MIEQKYLGSKGTEHLTDMWGKDKKTKSQIN